MLTRDRVDCPHCSHSKINYASLDIKEKIGEGSFSVVYKGIYNNEEVTHAPPHIVARTHARAAHARAGW